MSDSYINKPNRPLQLYAIIFLIFLYVPVLFLPLFSFNDSIYVRFPMEGFTLQWYRELMGREAVWAALMNSFKVGITASIIATALGIFGAKAITRYRFRGKGPIVTFIMLPLVVPLIIFGVALLVLMTSIGIPLSLYTVTIGHLIICIPFAIAVLLPRFEGFDASIEEASADLGENAWWTFWRVTLPMIFPGVVASLLLCFTVSFDEFILAFFLNGTEATLPMYIWGQLRFPQEFPSVLALSSMIIAASFIIVFFGQWINRDASISSIEGGK
ncbi:ABC transporter permease [Roseovarius sp. 2305UL8-3]|uniref:ABC transporter permease n=1 Tax=Roseovarius conchicola TaxID=3121636 RepID=UPI003529A168